MTTHETLPGGTGIFGWHKRGRHVTVDLRPPEDPEIDHSAPVDVDETRLRPEPERQILLDGWTLTPAAHPGGPPGGSTSVLVIEAADRWRSRIIFEQYSGSRFAYDGLRHRMPLFWQALSGRSTNPKRLARVTGALPVLRAALDDPARWYGSEAPHSDYSHVEWLLEWASCGVADAKTALALSDLDLRVLPERGRTSLVEWREAGTGTDAEIVDWLTALVGSQRRDDWWLPMVKMAQRRGFTPATYADWCASPAVHASRPTQVFTGLRDAGWTPTALRVLGREVRDRDQKATRSRRPPTRQPDTLVNLMRTWEAAMPPERASAFLTAGIGLAEATRMDASAAPPDLASLSLLGALAPGDDGPFGYLATHLLGDLYSYRAGRSKRR